MSNTYEYNPRAGSLFAQSFALYDNVPKSEQLFYYAQGLDCTNFISQCVWASYGGWIPGFTESVANKNLMRIKQDVRQVKGIWYGSKTNIGSNRWCRVEEFFSYVTDTSKIFGPMAKEIARGDWSNVKPAIIAQGDIIQLVVSTYTPNRFGHQLYVTRSGPSWDDILVCCHSDDRLDEPAGWFSQFPEVYTKMRILRFSNAVFES